MTAPDTSVDWVTCQRVLDGWPIDRPLTFGETAVVYRAVLAGGGTQNTLITMLGSNIYYLKKIRKHIDETGGIHGFPIVDGIRVIWSGSEFAGAA